MSNLIKFTDSLNKNGGASFNLMSGELNPKDGYFVSLEGHERKLDSVDIYDVIQYAKDKSVLLMDESNWLGGWVGTDTDGSEKVFLDVSRKYTDFDEAMQAGKDNDQLAIFDANTGTVIEL